MAATNAAIKQANNAMNKLNTAVNAQRQAEAGNAVANNLSKMNAGYNAAAAGFKNAAAKMNSINMGQIAKEFNNAAKAAEAASAVKAARSAKNGLNKLTNAMLANQRNMNAGKPPTTPAGVL